MDRILLAPEPLIRAVLVALCDNERLHARSLRYLDRLEKLQPPLLSTGTTRFEAPVNTQPQTTGSKILGKRKAPEPSPPRICVQCKHAFHPDSNNPQACAFHHGNLNINPSHRTWAGAGTGHASQHPPRQDTDDNREDRPEGFLWSCCGRAGAGPGCTEGEHLAVRADDRSKRPRRLDAAADPDELRTFEGKVLRPNEFVNDYLLDDDSSSDDEPLWGMPVASRAVASPEVEAGGGEGGGDAFDVRSEATERDSGGGSECAVDLTRRRSTGCELWSLKWHNLQRCNLHWDNLTSNNLTWDNLTWDDYTWDTRLDNMHWDNNHWDIS